MPAPRYQFTTAWMLDAPAHSVFDILYRVEDYPKWWPQFVEVKTIGTNVHDMVLQSFLRYRIKYSLANKRIDKRSLILEGHVDGDIRGRIQWDVDPREGGGCVARFSEQVVARKAVLNAFSFVLRPVFRWNHELVMRDGERGLQKYLAAAPTAQPDPGETSP